MRLLFDECVDQRLRLLFADYECHTAAYAELAGVKNGMLLDAAEAAGFEVINHHGSGDSVSTESRSPADRDSNPLRPTNRLADLKRLIPAAIAALGTITAGAVIRIE